MRIGRFPLTRLILLLSCFTSLQAQVRPYQVLRQVSLPCQTAGTVLRVDSLPVVPGSLHLRNKDGQIMPAPQVVPGDAGFVRFAPMACRDSLWLSFRVYTAPLFRAYARYSRDLIMPPIYERNVPAGISTFNNQREGPIVEGSMLRGFSSGNNQDLVPLSSLNLRIGGLLAPGIRISAAITEQDVPFQPEGTTQTLQDFDRIYVQLESNRGSLVLGDYAMEVGRAPYFLQYRKKVRGLELRQPETANRPALSFGTALARGRFSRNQFNGQEGVQGPYRLSGAAGETPIIVVSGTEVVYLDGQRMVRGLQGDYVIDYNLGEISFNPTRLIGAYSRIVVEFQYSDRNYVRSVSAASAETTLGKGRLHAAWFNEQDLRNQPLQTNLDLYDSSRQLGAREILAAAGNDPAAAVMSGIRSVAGFDPSGINYTLSDSLGYRILVHASVARTGETYYRASFSFKGTGAGDYVLDRSSANGKVYRWVAPSSGRRYGDYDPVISLPMPDRIRHLNSGWQSHWLPVSARSRMRIRAEGAMSTYDRNTFSAVGDSLRQGAAALGQAEWVQDLGTDSSWQLIGNLRYEHAGKRFRPVERFRDVEFERLWNRSLNNPAYSRPEATEGIGHTHWTLKGTNGFSLSQQFDRYAYQGFKGTADRSAFQYAPGKFELEAGREQVKTRSNALERAFEAYNAGLALNGKSSVNRLGWQNERSRFTHDTGAQLLQGSYAYTQFEAMREARFARNWQYTADLKLRDDLQPDSASFNPYTRAWQGGFSLKKQAGAGNTWQFDLRQRNLQVRDTSLGNLEDENQLTARANWTLRRDWINLQTFYQSLSGREQRRQYAYFEVPAGQGQFTWVDYNGNGTQEINEFESTPFRDQARYIRLLIPGNEFIRARGNEFSFNADLYHPESESGQSTGWRRFSSRHAMQTRQRNTADALLSLLPAGLAIEDARLISAQNLQRHTLFFNRYGGKIGADYTWQQNGGKFLIANGNDWKIQERHLLSLRINPGKQWQWNQFIETGTQLSHSDFNAVNRYQYSFWKSETRLSLITAGQGRISLQGRLNRFYGGSLGNTAASINELQAENQTSLGKRGFIETRLTWSNVRFPAASNTALAYDVLQGLQAGSNFRWAASLRVKAADRIQTDIGYEGRRIPGSRVVHQLRAEARYLF
jgi:hypothetical protein